MPVKSLLPEHKLKYPEVRDTTPFIAGSWLEGVYTSVYFRVFTILHPSCLKNVENILAPRLVVYQGRVRLLNVRSDLN